MTETLRTAGLKRMTLGVLLALAGTVAVSAWAQAPASEHHGPRGGHGSSPSALFMGASPERIDRGIDHMLAGLNATDAQRAQIRQIAQAASADLKAQREASRGLREQGMALFTAPVVDARAVEALRQQRMAQREQASKRITQAMLDVSAVLTPEQRAKLGERFKQRAEKVKQMHERRAASAPK